MRDSALTPTLGSAIFEELVKNTHQRDIQFLSKLSLVESFTSSEASKITGHPDATKRIKALLKDRLISQISDSSDLYQLNGLIRDELRALLSEDVDEFREIAHRCADIVKIKQPLKALELYGIAGDIEAATHLALSNIQHLIYQADLELISKWAPVISKAVGGGAKGEKLIKAYGLFSVGKYDQLKATLRDIESGITESPEDAVFAYECQLLRIRINFIYGHFEKMYEQIKALPKAPTNVVVRNESIPFSLHRNALSAAFYMQDFKGFMQVYKQIEPKFHDGTSNIHRISVNSFKAMQAFLSGQYLEANEYALAACTMADELEVRGSYFPYEAAYILMDTYLEFAEDEKSLACVEKYLPYAIKAHQYPWIAAFFAKAALIKSQAGETNAALALIGKGREVIKGPLFGTNISFILDGHELIIRLPFGDMQRLTELLFRMPETSQIKSFKIAIEMMRNPSALSKLSKSLPDETVLDRFRNELLVATALMSNRVKCRKHLENAIDLAIPNGYFRAFLNMPNEIKTLILDLAAEKPTIYLENLSRAIRLQSSVAVRQDLGLEAPLTKREVEILRRLSTGLPISDIASSLHISKNTIKTHLKSVYRKLNAESRTDAVAKGKELLLL